MTTDGVKVLDWAPECFAVFGAGWIWAIEPLSRQQRLVRGRAPTSIVTTFTSLHSHADVLTSRGRVSQATSARWADKDLDHRVEITYGAMAGEGGTTLVDR